MIKSFLLVVIPVLLLGCKSSKLVKVSTSGKEQLISLTINDQIVSLKITGDENTGAVFFETVKGKTWLQGEPVKIEDDKNHFEGEWNLDGRMISVNISKTPGNYEFSFKAKPDTGISKWGISLASTKDEYFTGLFERTVDGKQQESWKKGIKEALNIRGQEINMLINYTLSLYSPFYISSAGYGLFIKGTWPGHYDMCKTNPNRVKIEFEGPSLSGIIYTSSNPMELVKAHALYTGPTIVPPKWSFLPWRWRDEHSNRKKYYDSTKVEAPYNSMLVEDVLMMKAFDIPCGVYWVDRPWGKGPHGYDDFEWDPERFPEARKMIDWLHHNDMRFVLWIAPWVCGEMRNEAIRKGYSLPGSGPVGGVDSTMIASLDLTNAEGCKWWQEKGLEKMLKQGVDGFKLDRGEEMIPSGKNILLHDGRTAREVYNQYSVLYVKTVNESCRKIHGNDFLIFPRAGYTGSSRYSGFWGGDIGTPPEGLRTCIIAVQRNAINGYPIWGSDIGGYWQGDLDREICARWLAFGCFNPIMEFGPTENRAPWDMKKTPNYDTTLIAIWRLYAKIHTSLLDYTYNLVKQAHQTGMPVVRPLFLEFPKQEQSWNHWESFMYGPDILVSALWEKGKNTQTCYLPADAKWRDAWDNKVYDGGQKIEIQTPMYKIPVFIREGSKVDLGDLNKLYQQSLELAKKRPDLKKLEKEMFKN